MMIQFGRTDFDHIDNEALDFEQLEAFIQNNTSVVQTSSSGSSQTNSNESTNQINNPTNLPESPPDSGSVPPYSPNVKNLQLEQMSHLNTLTELHVPHHINLMTSPSELYMSNEHSQFGSLMHTTNKHESQLLQHHQQPATSQDHMMLYQVSQSGQIIELNHIHHQQNQQQLNGRLLDLETQTSTLSQMHEIQQQNIPANMNDNLQIMGESYNAQIGNHGPSLNTTTSNNNGKKRRNGTNFTSAINAEMKVKGYGKSSSSDAKTIKHYFGNKNKKRHHHHIVTTHDINEPNDVKLNDKKATASDNKTTTDNNFHENNENKSNNSFVENAITKGNESGSDGSQIQCIRFSTFQQHQWHTLLDQNHQELTTPHFRVDADKGFNFSNSDDAFVCQKKNHFQITCHVQVHGNGVYVKTPTGIEKIRTFHLHFYGVKLETPAQTIRIEQSQSDRSKKPFFPVLIDLQNGQVSKVTVGRLHFSETTCNNMRKKGRPNPEQRYFQLVVGLHAHTFSGYYPIVSHASERIIVRASNPGQFEGDVDLCCWQRGVTQNSIFHQGKIGINTDMPDECLVVNGNIKVSGHIVQPSDERVKNNICELEPADQLENINQIRVVKYKFEQKFADNQKFDCDRYQTGIIAQELQKIIPDAVHSGGKVNLSDGSNLDNFLQVDKDRVFMENIGAVKQLSKLIDNLELRIQHLENVNHVGIFDKIKILQFLIIVMVFIAALWY